MDHYNTDQGVEFFNSKVQEYFREHGIKHFFTLSETKAAIAERFIRTLKNRIYKYFTFSNSQRWVDSLQEIVSAYNLSCNRSIGMRSVDVNQETEDEVIENLYGNLKPVEVKFKVGDHVRIQLEKGIFSKGYKQSWSDEIYTVEECVSDSPFVYKLRSEEGKVLSATF